MRWQTYNTENIKSMYLFKFLSEKNLFRFLESGNIWFARSDKFGDKMECVTINDLLKPIPDFNEIESRKRKHLISCFHEGNKETLAFWDTYAKTDEERRKFALRFNRDDFIQRIESRRISELSIPPVARLVHGKVKYKNLIGAKAEKLVMNKVKYPAFRKEYVFAYEREYRFDILLKDETEQPGFNFNIGTPDTIPFAIYVNPLLDKKDYKVCLERINSSEYKQKFKMSTLTKWLKPDLWK